MKTRKIITSVTRLVTYKGSCLALCLFGSSVMELDTFLISKNNLENKIQTL